MKKLTYRLRDIREERFWAKYEIRGLHKLRELEASEYHRVFFASSIYVYNLCYQNPVCKYNQFNVFLK